MSPYCLTRGYAGKWVTLVNGGAPQLFVDLIRRFQRSSTTEKRDRFKYSKQSLSFAYDMANGDICAPKGIRIPVAALKGLCPRPLDDGGNTTYPF
jgi:hypothetical protein